MEDLQSQSEHIFDNYSIAPLIRESFAYLDSFSIILQFNFIAPDLVEQALAG